MISPPEGGEKNPPPWLRHCAPFGLARTVATLPNAPPAPRKRGEIANRDWMAGTRRVLGELGQWWRVGRVLRTPNPLNPENKKEGRSPSKGVRSEATRGAEAPWYLSASRRLDANATIS